VFWPLRRRSEVEVEVLLLGVADEVPQVGERAQVMNAQFVEDNAPRRADARWVLEQLYQLLVGKPRRAAR
jgi:hypothetical protein